MTAKLENPCFEAALKYADLGIPVFPVDGKQPIWSEAKTGRKWGATTEPKKINSMWTRDPRSNVGLVMGGSIIGVDLDVKNGVNAVRWWEEQAGFTVDPTPQAETPSGGRHYYFAIPDDLDFEIRNSQSKVAPGVDIRGVDGFMLGPPSRTAKGVYIWTHELGVVDLQSPPDWLVEKLRAIAKPKKKTGRPTNTEKERREDVALLKAMGVKGLGHEAVRDFAARWAAKGVPQWVTEAAVQANAHTFDKNAQDLIDSAYEKFAPIDFKALDDDDPRAFLGLLDGKDNEPFRHTSNAIRLFQHMPDLRGILGRNVLNGSLLRLREWDGSQLDEPVGWTDKDWIEATSRIQQFEVMDNEGKASYPLAGFSPETIKLATKNAGADFHPIKREVESLPEWDGKKRLDTWLTDTFGVEDTPLHRAYSRKFCIAMIARAHAEPGRTVKVDTTLVISGTQGLNKSQFAERLAGRESLFTDHLPDLRDDQSASMAVAGRWVVEISEGDMVAKADKTRLKGFLTRKADKFKVPYGSFIEEFPRSCVFIMPTNDQQFLTDNTGSRRFWCVKATRKADLNIFDREQILAEAKAAYNAGEEWWLSDEEEELRTDVAGEFEAANEMIDIIKPVLARVVEGRIVTVQEVLDAVYGVGARHYNDPFGRDVKAAFGKLGWETKRTKHGRGYIRTEASLPPVGEAARAGQSLSSAFKEVE